ncbi:MAG: entericidin [Alphaproteobacteria bacterium CG_4_10_14_0_8_um_filter_53_9]|nr:MAG: entericidin [Alphaproteobacteria bacterium CG_4_10_14_0_8_um_filter_53_9]
MGLLVVALIIVGAVAYVGGGNTVEGFGQDVEKTGEQIQGSGE